MNCNKPEPSSRITRRVLSLQLRLLIAAIALLLVSEQGCADRSERCEAMQTVLGADRITKGPVLLRAYQDRVALMWETNTKGPWKLCYSEKDKLQRCVESPGRRAQYQTKANAGQAVKETAFIHKVWLDDLEPGEVYDYHIAHRSYRSKNYEFRTTSADVNEVRFIVYGDSRTYPSRHRKLVELMKKERVDFVVHSGDLVTSGDRYEQWGPQFFEPLKGLTESVPIYIAKGNHEGNGGNYEKLLSPPGQRNSFGFDYGPIHYFCVDNVSRGLRAEKQLGLIAADAKRSQAIWKFVSYHVPSVNFGGHWSDWGYPDALPAFAEAGVDFVIVGHSHQYERFKPVAPQSGTDGSYVTYITTGGGGASLSGVEPVYYHMSAKKIHHFCLFSINGNKLTMDAIDIDGKVIDHLEISKSDGRLNRQYLRAAVPMEAIRLHQELLSASPKPLSTRPRKNRPFTVACTLSIPELNEPAKMTFSLRGDEATYELPEPEIVAIPKRGGTVQTKLTVTPLVEVKVPKDSRGRARPIVPALWLDFRYEIGRVRETVSKPVTAKAKRD